MSLGILEYVMVSLLGLIPIVNPFSTAPIFIGLTKNYTEYQRINIAMISCFYMAAVLIVFLIAGSVLMSFFGITINSLRIAGGLIIGYMGFRMLFPSAVSGNEAVDGLPEGSDIAFTPLAIPMLSGPGSIAVVIGMSAEVAAFEVGGGRIYGYLAVTIAILLTALISFLVLRASTKVVKFLGATGIDAITRIMGFFLICIAVEFIIGALGSLIREFPMI